MTWDEYLMGFAHHAAAKSKDQTRVGCAIVGPGREIRMTGFNGPPRGVADDPARRERPAKYLWTSHAEENAIAFAARQGIETIGCTAYVTHHPCARCARTLIQAGIACVVVGDGTTSMPREEFEVGATMFIEAGVEVRAYSAEAVA